VRDDLEDARDAGREERVRFLGLVSDEGPEGCGEDVDSVDEGGGESEDDGSRSLRSLSCCCRGVSPESTGDGLNGAASCDAKIGWFGVAGWFGVGAVPGMRGGRG